MNEILVVGGVHGNEPFGPALVESLQADPIEGIDSFIANEEAVKAGVRFIDSELSVDSNPAGTSYEDRRLKELVEKGKKYSLILEYHNAEDPAVYEAWMHSPADALRKPVQWLMNKAGINYAIRFSEDWLLYKLLPQTVSIEMGMPIDNYPEWEKREIKRWRSILREMTRTGLSQLQPEAHSPDIVYLEATESISRDQAKQSGIEQFAGIQRYERLPDYIIDALQLKPLSYRALWWGYRNMSKPIPDVEGEREYWGQLAVDVKPFI